MKRPKFEVWAIQSQDGRPPGPLLHPHQTQPPNQVWRGQPVTGLDSGGQACVGGPQVSRRGNLEGTVNGNLQIWSLSSTIPAACCTGGRFEGRRWASDCQTARRKSGYPKGLSFRDFCAAALLCLAARYRLWFTRCPQTEVRLRLNACRPGAQEGKRRSHGDRRLVLAISAFPETRAVVSLRRLATHYRVCDGPPEGPRVPWHLISIHLNHWSRRAQFGRSCKRPSAAPARNGARWPSTSDRLWVIFRPTVYY